MASPPRQTICDHSASSFRGTVLASTTHSPRGDGSGICCGPNTSLTVTQFVTLIRLALVTVRLAIATMLFAFAQSIFVESSSGRRRRCPPFGVQPRAKSILEYEFTSLASTWQKYRRCKPASGEVSAFGTALKRMLARLQGSVATNGCRLAATPASEIAHRDKLP